MTAKAVKQKRTRGAKKEKQKPAGPSREAAKKKVDMIRSGLDPDARDERGQLRTLKGFQISRRASEEIIKDLQTRGKFFREGELGYYLDLQTRKLIDIGQSALDLGDLLSKYGLNPTEKVFKYVVAEMFLHAINKGEQTHVHHFAHLNFAEDDEPVLYIACDINHVLRINADSYEVTDNGIDGVLFLTSEYTAPLDIPAEFVAARGLLKSLLLGRIPFDTDVLTREESELLLLAEMLALLMREAIPDTRPIFAFIGEKGSGKTTAVRMVGRTLYGPSWDVTDITSNIRDFDTLISTDDFVCFDNVDENIKWLNNKLAVAASGAKVSRNKLYETHCLLQYPIISMVATTSRTPCFRRDDVADRLVILRTVRLDRSDQVEFNPDVLQGILLKRRELWGELIFRIQKVLRLMRETDWQSIRVKGKRLQGFARLTILLAKTLGCEETASQAWEKMGSAQRQFAAEGEALFDAMPEWIADNAGREVTAGELNKELLQIASCNGTEWPYGSGRSLGQKLSQLRESLSEMFDVSERECPSRKQRVYRFWPKGHGPESDSDEEGFRSDSANDSGA